MQNICGIYAGNIHCNESPPEAKYKLASEYKEKEVKKEWK
jgi:hypothetical protein